METSRIITRDAVIECARRWLGTPYHHQASLRGTGTDCLGLVRGMWRDLYGENGELPPAYSRDWAEARAEETLLSAASRHLSPRPIAERRGGDVAVFRYRPQYPAKHVGVLTARDRFIHAIEGAPVSEVHLNRWWERRIAGVFSFPGITE